MSEQLLQRLNTLEAIEAIKRLKHDYFYYCDTKQPEKVRTCFTEGLVNIDFGVIGQFDNRDALVEIFASIACGEFAENIIEFHHAQNPRIDIIDANNAKGTWGLLYSLINSADNTVTQLGGIYHDEYRCVDGCWQISASTFNATSRLVVNTSEQYLALVEAVRPV